MRRIELKALGPEPMVRYAEVLAEVVRRPLNLQQGIQIEEMRKSIRLLDAIDAANGTLELEDADHQFLKQKLDNMGWNVADRRIVQLIDDVSNA
jgi:hypothetical protein